MRRYTFYFSIALLAFVVGSFVVFKFYWNDSDITKPEISLVETVNAQQEKNDFYQIKSEDFAVEDLADENLEEIHQPIIRQWLKGEKIEEKYLSYKTYEEAEDYDPENFTPSLIDVNFDGKKELVIKGGCSPTGNCGLFIYEKIGKTYRAILNAVQNVNVFRLRKTSNKNYQNIEARMHGSWNAGDGVIYEFNGKTYEPAKCFSYIYEEYKDKKGNDKVKSTPKLKYYECNFEE